MLVLTGERGPFDSRIAFASRRRGRFKEIYAMSLDGGDLRAVTHDDSIALRTVRHRHRELIAVFISSFLAIFLQQIVAMSPKFRFQL